MENSGQCYRILLFIFISCPFDNIHTVVFLCVWNLNLFLPWSRVFFFFYYLFFFCCGRSFLFRVYWYCWVIVCVFWRLLVIGSLIYVGNFSEYYEYWWIKVKKQKRFLILFGSLNKFSWRLSFCKFCFVTSDIKLDSGVPIFQRIYMYIIPIHVYFFCFLFNKKARNMLLSVYFHRLWA